MLLLPQFIGSLALVAFLSSLYGVARTHMRTAQAQTLLGLAFGLVAMLQMSAPLEMLPGVILDMRNVPIALAGAFLGWRGALLCLGMAIVTRFSIGGVGMWSGIAGMMISCTAGYMWNCATLTLKVRGVRSLFGFGVIVSAHMAAAVLLPWDACLAFFATAALPMAALNLLSVPIAAAFLEHERVRIIAEGLSSADQGHDPTTGLAHLPHFRREPIAVVRSDCNGRVAGLMTIRLLGVDALRRDLGAKAFAQLLCAIRLRIKQIYSADMPSIAATDDDRILIALDFRQVAERDMLETQMRRLLSDVAYQVSNTTKLRIGVSLRSYPTPTVDELDQTLTAIALHQASPVRQPQDPAPANAAVDRSTARHTALPPARRGIRHDRLFAAANVLLATKGR